MEMLHGKSKGTVLWQELAEFPETVQSAGNSLAFSCGGSLPAPFDCAGQIKKNNANIYKQYQTIKLQDLMLILSPDTTRPCFSGFGV